MIEEYQKVAKTKAEEVLEKHNIQKIPVNPVKIAEGEGLSVFKGKFTEYENVSGFIHYKSNAIYINELEEFLPRQIFTIAHELGHHFLHRELIEQGKYEYQVSMRNTSISVRDTIEETQANIFAGNLLVPRAFLDKYYGKYTIYDMALLFAVSQPVIRIRLEQEYGYKNYR